MDRVNKREVKNPRKNPSLLSSFTFAWLLDTYLLGWKRELSVFDLSPPAENHTSQYMGQMLIDGWNEEKSLAKASNEKNKPSLARVLRKCFMKQIAVIGIVTAVGEIISKLCQPLFLIKILQYFFEDSKMTRDEVYLWGTALFISNIFYSFVSHVSIYYMMVVAMRVRTACCVLLYEKIMHVSKAVMQSETSVGQMINIFSADMSRMDFLFPFVHYSWISPILVLIAFIFIYREMTVSGLLGFCLLLICLPIQGYIAKFVSRLTADHSTAGDERLRLTNEIIRGVQVIKMYGWEKPFTMLVDKARKIETKILTITKIAYGVSLSFEQYVPRTCLFITVVAYVLFGNQITAENVFLVSAYYNVMRLIAFRRFPVGLNAIGELIISIDRVQHFVSYDEIDSSSVNRNSNPPNQSTTRNIALEFVDITAKWIHDAKNNTLERVSFAVQSGTLVAIIGQVGAGKTSIFQAILGELPILSGKLEISGKISYCSQEPWIFASSIQQNILFGQPMDEDKYEKVINVCQLRKDFDMFPHGDKTLVGERGISLSGGQCARVNLARSVYVDADIYLLDDPLSAVDTSVGRRIFERCIKTYLKGKTVLLVTHQYQYLKDVDQLIVLKQERVEAMGSLQELQESGLELLQMLTLEESKEEIQKAEISKSEASSIASKTYDDPDEEPIMKDEVQEVGAISKGVYISYIKAAGNPIFGILTLLFTVCAEIFAISGDYFIAYWLNKEYEVMGRNRTIINDPNVHSKDWYISVYAGIILATVILGLLQATWYFEVCRRISNNLYKNMFINVIRATMTFFNENTMGRIMNRFAKDVVVIDRQLAQIIRDINMSFVTFIIVIILITIVNPWLFMPSVFIIILFALCRMFYVRTSRSIKRLEGITRSPVFTHLSAVLDGLTTIRALNAQQILREEFDNHQDVYSAVWIISAAGDRALGFYTDVLCSILIGLITWIIISFKDTTTVSNAGLIITQCTLLIGVLQWGIKQSSELETNMTSVERVLEYSNLKEEPPLESTPKNKPPENWPKEGRLCFKNVHLMYDNSLALNNLNFSIEPKEKIGIVGRTGAGKSSIITALFRLADIEGDIFIDGLPTSSLGLHDFRTKISIIPQEPVLFIGTLRCNLDPFEEYQDIDLWQALDDVELKSTIVAKEGLDMKVTDGGSNFSVGERQLLCLARAVLRKNVFLVLDEATANVDPKTDELIQQTVRRKFQNCTVLTIAHRLNTVMDSDRVLVMDAGSMVEFGHPFDLLQNEDGYFYNMVQQTGPSTSKILMEIAKESYPRQHTRL